MVCRKSLHFAFLLRALAIACVVGAGYCLATLVIAQAPGVAPADARQPNIKPPADGLVQLMQSQQEVQSLPLPRNSQGQNPPLPFGSRGQPANPLDLRQDLQGQRTPPKPGTDPTVAPSDIRRILEGDPAQQKLPAMHIVGKVLRRDGTGKALLRVNKQLLLIEKEMQFSVGNTLFEILDIGPTGVKLRSSNEPQPRWLH